MKWFRDLKTFCLLRVCEGKGHRWGGPIFHARYYGQNSAARCCDRCKLVTVVAMRSRQVLCFPWEKRPSRADVEWYGCEVLSAATDRHGVCL